MTIQLTNATVIAARLILRNGTASEATVANPILLKGEEGYETDTRRRKVGDGTSVWTSLPYQEDGSELAATLADASDDDGGPGYLPFSHSRVYPQFSSGDKMQQFINVRDAPFNAPLNGIDDDGPAVQAAIDHYKGACTLYAGGGPRILMPSGLVRNDSGSLNVTSCHGLELHGLGRGATQLLTTTNNPAIEATDVIALPLHHLVLRDFTLMGPGSTNANSDGVRLGANNSCEIDLRVWGHRAAISLANSFQTIIDKVRIDGLGGLACYDGLLLRDGELSSVENAVEVRGGQIRGCTRYGVRGECITGSKVFGLEVLECGAIGVYLGDSPGSKPLKWFTWVGGLIDTCPDLLVVTKGTSSVAELIQITEMWMGYASDNANGIGADFRDVNHLTFEAIEMVNVGTGISTQGVTNSHITVKQMMDYDRLNIGSHALTVTDSTDNVFRLGTLRKTAGSPTVDTVFESGTSARNQYRGVNADGLVYTIPGNESRASGRMVSSGFSANIPQRMTEYTLSSLPAASSFWKGMVVAVTNESSGYTVAFCDGTNWRRVQDRVVVS
jgi:hypothetical protein